MAVTGLSIGFEDFPLGKGVLAGSEVDSCATGDGGCFRVITAAVQQLE